MQVSIGHYSKLIGHLRFDDGGDGGLSKEVWLGVAIGSSLLSVIVTVAIVTYCIYKH